jgi:hypothetical protein
MHPFPALLLGGLMLAACGGSAPQAAPPTEDAARITCDRFAARAIQTADVAQAASLSSRAATCYSALPIAPA